jgi:hypothetical protein
MLGDRPRFDMDGGHYASADSRCSPRESRAIRVWVAGPVGITTSWGEALHGAQMICRHLCVQ